MIIVEIKVPALGEVYDFQLDEKQPVEKLLGEICEILCKKTKSDIKDQRNAWMLFSMSQKRELNPKSTLSQNGISEGDLLLLV